MVELDGELVDGFLEGLDLGDEPLHGLVPAELHVRPVGSVFQPGLRQLQRVFLCPGKGS